MFCPKCGNEIQDGMKFCGKCGNSVPFANAKSNVTANAGNTNGKRTKKPFLIIGGAVALSAIIALIVIVINFNKVKVGDLIEFGTYEQDGNLSNGGEPIEWQVLAVEDGKALLISKYGLEAQPYNTEYTSVTWEKCSLRKWLNNDFYDNAFTSSEKKKIVDTYVTADKNPKYETNPGNSTYDNVFLLSINEVNRYFGNDSSRMCTSTIQARNNDVYTYSNGCCWWWLRSPGSDDSDAADVSSGGTVNYYGHGIKADDYAVRPAVWIDL